jgi:hypothetical protein
MIDVAAEKAMSSVISDICTLWADDLRHIRTLRHIRGERVENALRLPDLRTSQSSTTLNAAGARDC